MEHMKKYGKRPFKVALIHGGPGASGEMAPVAKELASICGILEPFQTEKSIDGQLLELKSILEKEGDLPVILVGFSWGAWLSYIFAAKYPSFVEKLILIGSGPFEEKYTKSMMQTRLSRLNEDEKTKIDALLKSLNDPATKNKNSIFENVGELLSKAESFDPVPDDDAKTLVVRYDIFEPVWEQASQLRASGELLKFGKCIQCPVIAIHGDYDPHDPEGVKKPLSCTLKQFRFILLNECGHCPWIERKAKEQFYMILKQEICSLNPV
jgi:pimeloyl-ACP methyl ester carboxylesterase